MPFRNGHQAVIGIFPEVTRAGAAVERLNRSGFVNRDISLLMPAKADEQNVAYRKSTKAAERGALGAAGGALIGSGFGWLAGMGALAIPGIGPFIAAGPLLSVFAGAGIGGTVGGIAAALSGFGVPEYEARRYEGFVKEGHVLLSVHVDDGSWAFLAKEILRDAGARDITIADEEKAPIFMTGNVRPITRADDYALHK